MVFGRYPQFYSLTLLKYISCFLHYLHTHTHTHTYLHCVLSLSCHRNPSLKQFAECYVICVLFSVPYVTCTCVDRIHSQADTNGSRDRIVRLSFSIPYSYLFYRAFITMTHTVLFTHCLAFEELTTDMFFLDCCWQ